MWYNMAKLRMENSVGIVEIWCVSDKHFCWNHMCLLKLPSAGDGYGFYPEQRAAASNRVAVAFRCLGTDEAQRQRVRAYADTHIGVYGSAIDWSNAEPAAPGVRRGM
jgi:hypothetical protein